MTDPADFPQSVEEAGALLGATITTYGTSSSHRVVKPPKGTHSAYSLQSPVPTSELFMRLHALRALLRSAPQDEPLVAAPSLLALLMKLLGNSTTLASPQNQAAAAASGGRVDPPPMWSTPIRKMWVDCVVLCHKLGDGLSGNARINLFGFVSNMMKLAATNPRSAKAAGGTRIAALQVLAGLFEEPKLSQKLSSWALGVIQLAQRALKSSGNGEPTFRVASVQCACAVAVACRQTSLRIKPLQGKARLLLRSALEDKAIVEVVRLVKLGAADRFPEVRSATAVLAGLVAPMLVQSGPSGAKPAGMDGRDTSPTTSLEDVMTVAFKNLDDESAYVSACWAEAFARCICSSIEYCEQLNSELGGAGRRDVEADGTSSPANAASSSGSSMVSSGRKGVVLVSLCSSLQNAFKYLVSMFVKVGGELVAPRAGGAFSVGGRAVRVGLTHTMVQLLMIQSRMGRIGEGRALSTKEAIMFSLAMVGSDMESQLSVGMTDDVSTSDGLGATSGAPTARDQAPSLFGQGPKVSSADAAIVRTCACRILRDGVGRIGSEATQISVVHEFIQIMGQGRASLKANQIQVLLIELSHLLSVLGEAAASAVEDLLPALKDFLLHQNHGVRYEAAVTCSALCSVFPVQGRKLVQSSINDLQLNHAELMALASTKTVQDEGSSGSSLLLRFGRRTPQKPAKTDGTLKHQYAVHGLGLAVSLLIKNLPSAPGGLPSSLFVDVLSVSEILISTRFNEIMLGGNVTAACTCVRAGFTILCGVFVLGSSVVASKTSVIFDLWRKTCKPPKDPQAFTPDHELICIDALLSAIVAFLRNCSDLLLSIPDALSQTSLILEELLGVLSPGGRLGGIPATRVALTRHLNAKSSLMEAFTWLPPGSYPMVADDLFEFSISSIKYGSENDATTSILDSLVNSEDNIIEAVSFSRSTRPGQVGRASALEQDLVILSSEATTHLEREFSLLHDDAHQLGETHQKSSTLHGSHVLAIVGEDDSRKPPTPLHAVGTWKRPYSPASSARVRLVDTSIQAFAAAFGLKGGKEQQNAMLALESLIPPVLRQVARAMGVGTQGTELDKRGESAAVVNVVSTLLLCLQSLPIHETSNNVPVGLGPQWMTKAKDLLLMMISSPLPNVRRAVAEGLALLATLGVSEDAHFLQSAVLHSLDEVMQGNKLDMKARALPFDPLAASRAGAMLAVGYIQRTTYAIGAMQDEKSRSRGSPSKPKGGESEQELPAIQIMSRLLPSVMCFGVQDYFGARTAALYSIGLLLVYSDKFSGSTIDPVHSHLLMKFVEIIEDNFAAAWTAASADYDQGNEADKLTASISFVAVVLRNMTLVLPLLKNFNGSDRSTALRFSHYARMIAEIDGCHPVVMAEALAFYEVLSSHQTMLPPISPFVDYTENAMLCSVPLILACFDREHCEVFGTMRWRDFTGCSSSLLALESAISASSVLSANKVVLADWTDLMVISKAIGALELFSGRRGYASEKFYRNFGASREVEKGFCREPGIESAFCQLVSTLVGLEKAYSQQRKYMLLRCFLMCKTILSGVSADSDEDEAEPMSVAGVVSKFDKLSQRDTTPVFESAISSRWQVKCQAAKIGLLALRDLRDVAEAPEFDAVEARAVCQARCRELAVESGGDVHSYLSLHINDVLKTVCAAATATVDQAELRILQECAVELMTELISCFAQARDPDQRDDKLLAEFLPQLSSCVKAALAAKDEQGGQSTYRLFLAGCKSLKQFIHAKLGDDPAVLKRVSRSALLSLGEVTFFDPEARPKQGVQQRQSEYENPRARLLVTIGKVDIAGFLLEHAPGLMGDLSGEFVDVGSYASALALDGVRLLVNANMSLSAVPLKQKAKGTQASGYFYESLNDVDDFVRAALAENWGQLASSAVGLFSSLAQNPSGKTSQLEGCGSWIQKIAPVLCLGLQDALTSLSDNLEYERQGIPTWACGVNSEALVISCARGISLLVKAWDQFNFDSSFLGDLERCLSAIHDNVVLPVLHSKSALQTESVEACASLVHTISQHNDGLNGGEGSTLFIILLKPLEYVATADLDTSDERVAALVRASMGSLATFVSNGEAQVPLVGALLPVAVKVLSKMDESSQLLHPSALSLLRGCFNADSVSVPVKRKVLSDMAMAENWLAWKGLVSNNGGVSLVLPSIAVIKSLLLDSRNTDRQVSALQAVQDILQTSTSLQGDLSFQIAIQVTPEVLGILRAYGVLDIPKAGQSRRIEACASCMKILLVVLSLLMAEASKLEEEAKTAFVVAVSETFAQVLRFNGLPNHPPPTAAGLAEPALGRLCAQALLHLARTAAGPFKASMAQLSEADRAVLEFAVRGEMSGYAPAGGAAASAPVKKKLSLKGFTK